MSTHVGQNVSKSFQYLKNQNISYVTKCLFETLERIDPSCGLPTWESLDPNEQSIYYFAIESLIERGIINITETSKENKNECEGAKKMEKITANEFLKLLVAEGGYNRGSTEFHECSKIVSSNSLSPEQVNLAWKENRIYVDEDGFGYVLIYGKM